MTQVKLPKITPKREGTKCWTPIFRGGFVSLLKSKAVGEKGEQKYSVAMMFQPDADLSTMQEALREAAKNKWGDAAKKMVAHPKFRDPFKDQGTQVDKEGNLYAGMIKGAQLVQASCKAEFGPVRVIDTDMNDLIDASEVYSGAWYRATVNAYAWEYLTMKGVSFGLINVQKVAEGERLGGGRSDVTEDFQPIASANDTDAGDSWDDAA